MRADKLKMMLETSKFKRAVVALCRSLYNLGTSLVSNH
jgi:hypothetical protein